MKQRGNTEPFSKIGHHSQKIVFSFSKKRSLALLLSLCTLLSGCARIEAITEEEAGTQTKMPSPSSTEEAFHTENHYGVPLWIQNGKYPEIRDAASDEVIGRRLTWENIQSFPIKSEDMTTDELRMLCVNFFHFSKTALWIPDEDFHYIRNNNGTRDEMLAEKIYGGLPYIGSSTGNIYRLMDYMDEKSGVVDMSEASKFPKLFGSQCSVGSYWGWARVINSADYDWTFHMVASRGFLPVGPMTYDLTISSFDELSTVQICADNGEQIMYQSYANMLPADGLISTDPSVGHATMCTGKPVVVYRSDGTIDGEKSYLYISDQNQGWVKEENSAGVHYEYKKYIQRQQSFWSLFQSNYLPFTFGEFLGTDPIEETECHFSFSGDQITIEQLKNSSVTANYGISDIYVYVKNFSGEVLFYKVARANTAGKKTMSFFYAVQKASFEKYADGNHRIEIVCQLGTGERPTIYTGTLIR